MSAYVLDEKSSKLNTEVMPGPAAERLGAVEAGWFLPDGEYCAYIAGEKKLRLANSDTSIRSKCVA